MPEHNTRESSIEVQNDVLAHLTKYGNKAVFVACTLLEDATRNGKMNQDVCITLKQSFKDCLREEQKRLAEKIAATFNKDEAAGVTSA